MITVQSMPSTNDAKQAQMSGVVHHVETMSKEELQAHGAKAQLELQKENAALKERVASLEAEAATVTVTIRPWRFSVSV